MKWWLISDDDVKEIRMALEEAIREIDHNCAVTGCSCDLQGQCLCSRIQRDALHSLDSGCHITNSIPTDFQSNAKLSHECNESAGVDG